MRKLIEAELLDIFPIDNGFFYLSKEKKSNGEISGVFHKYNQDEEKIYQASITDYIDAKFGYDGRNIASQLGDFVTCRTVEMYNGDLLSVYPDGSFKIIHDGRLSDIDELKYLESPACSPAINGRDVWLAVPDANAVINYSIEHNRVELRIGGPATKAFCHPVDVKIYNNKLYICNEYSYKIRCISLGTYNVEDYRIFNEEIKEYFRSDDCEYAVLKSGIYLL